MSSESENFFQLDWPQHDRKIMADFNAMWVSKELTDVSIGVANKVWNPNLTVSTIHAHKVVLAACSGWFRAFFAMNPHPTPFILIKDADFESVKRVMRYVFN